jgi:MYXO-CTERM domain-containing protein
VKKLLKLTVTSLAASLATLTAASAFACGAPFGAGVNVDPHQDIILVHKGGTESYVFQPTFCGAAKDFGLILPVPSVLSAMPEKLADAKAFTAAVDITKPSVEERTECISRGGFGGVGSDGTDAGAPSATVVASGTVGFLDWTQLKADSEESFTSWLDANGYKYEASAKSAFASYVSKGWYFLAFKVNQGAPTGSDNCRSFGPVKVSFPTDVPVIPSRIATAGQTITSGGYPYGFSWRVFGISDAAAQIDFASAGSTYTQKLDFSGALTADDATKLGGLANAGDRLTRLTLWFDGSATDDVALARKTPSNYRAVEYHTTYVDCGDGDAMPIDPADGGTTTTNGAAPGSSSGCSTSGSRTGSLAALGLFVAAAVLRLRRR